VLEHFLGVSLWEQALQAPLKGLIIDRLGVLDTEGILQEELEGGSWSLETGSHGLLELLEHVILPVVASEGIDPVVLGQVTLLVGVKV